MFAVAVAVAIVVAVVVNGGICGHDWKSLAFMIMIMIIIMIIIMTPCQIQFQFVHGKKHQYRAKQESHRSKDELQQLLHQPKWRYKNKAIGEHG